MGVSLRYETWGDGPNTLLLLHGFTGNRLAWSPLKEHLAPHLRMVVVDLPGHGESPPLGLTGREGWEATLSALEQVLDVLGVREVDLLGYSQGARVALGLALRLKWRVRRLVLESVNPGLKRSQDRAARKAQDDELAQFIETHGIPAFVARWEALPIFAGLRALPQDVQDELRGRRLSCSAAGLASALRSMGLGIQPNYWTELAELPIPTLLLTGAKDLRFNEIARKMTSELRMSWWHAFENSYHVPHLEAPQDYVQEVLFFLQAPEGSVAGSYKT